MEEEFLSTSQAAEMLGLRQETISRLIRKNKLDGHKLGGFYVVTRESVEVYAEAIKGKGRYDPTRKIDQAGG